MKSPQQRCEEYVRKEIPELMELSFGCEATLPDGELIKVLGDSLSEATYKEDKCEVYYLYNWESGRSDCHMWCAKKDLKIIGHPIHLEHWLRVLEEKFGDWNDICLRDEYLSLCVDGSTDDWIDFSTVTGQPNDYKALADLLGLSE